MVRLLTIRFRVFNLQGWSHFRAHRGPKAYQSGHQYDYRPWTRGIWSRQESSRDRWCGHRSRRSYKYVSIYRLVMKITKVLLVSKIRLPIWTGYYQSNHDGKKIRGCLVWISHHLTSRILTQIFCNLFGVFLITEGSSNDIVFRCDR